MSEEELADPVENKDNKVPEKPARRDPIKVLTLIVLLIAALFLAWYLVADRLTMCATHCVQPSQQIKRESQRIGDDV